MSEQSLLDSAFAAASELYAAYVMLGEEYSERADRMLEEMRALVEAGARA